MTDVRVPTVGYLETIVLASLRRLGGSGSTIQIHQAVEESPGLSAEQRAVKHGAGPGSEIQYRTRWALVSLRRRGLLERIAARSWALTSAGTAASHRPTGEG